MGETNTSLKSFPDLESYGQFILENLLEKAAEESVIVAEKLNLPLLNLFKNYGRNDLIEYFKINLKNFLTHLVSGTALTFSEDILHKWMEGKHPEIPRNSVKATDVILAYSIRKRVFLNLLRNYTNNPDQIFQIVEEIEDFYSHLEHIALSNFLQIQKEENDKFNKELQEQQMELEAINEELQASDEELRTSIEELYEASQKLQNLNENLEKQVTSRTKQIEDQKEWLHNLFMEVPALLGILTGREGVISLINPMFSKLWGRREVFGKPMRKAWPELEKQGYFEMVEKVYDTGESITKNEFSLIFDNKYNGKQEQRYFNLLFTPQYNSNREREGVLFCGVDVTNQVKARQKLEKYTTLMKEMNESLRRKNENLRKLNIDLDNFIYTASHDLKSPAVNLEGLITLLKKGLDQQLDPELKKIIELIENSTLKLKKTIIDLSDITKAQKNLDGEIEKIIIKDVLEDVKNDIQNSIKESGATIIENLQIQEINYNRSNLKSILFNLLTNAIKYRSSTRSLIIKVYSLKEGDFTVICVEDNGLGIEKSQQPKLFYMFKRLHSHVEGTGIGLYIIKRIVENNGGKITVESEVEKGSKFKVFFP